MHKEHTHTREHGAVAAVMCMVTLTLTGRRAEALWHYRTTKLDRRNWKSSRTSRKTRALLEISSRPTI